MSPVEPGNSEPERLNESPSGFDGLRSDPGVHVRFGIYEFNLQTHELRKGGLRLKIPHQSFQILAMLLKRPGEVVSREDLRSKLWPGDVFVNFEASLNSAMQRLRSALQDTSQEPRYIETLPRAGYRFIANVEPIIPVFEEAPQREGAQNAATSISDELTQVDAIPGGTPVQHRSWPIWAALGILLILLTAYIGLRYSRRTQRMQEAQTQPSSLVLPSALTRRSVAVMGFTNASGNPRESWLSTAFTEMLVTELAAGGQLRTVAEEDVARAKHELSLSNRDSYGGNTLTKIHKDLGCDYVVAGSYLATGETGSKRVRLDARLQDAVTGDTVASFAVIGSQSDLFDLASRAGEQLRAQLGVGALTATESEEVKLALPSNPEAARLYSEGLAKSRLYENVAASDLYQKVIRLQPEYAPAYSALASAWFALGYDGKAADAVRKAMDLSGNLPGLARLQTEARYRKINGDWKQAAEIYSRLQQSHPDSLDNGLSLAYAQNAMGNSSAATATIVALRKLPSPECDDPRIDLTEARIAGDLSDYKREQASAESAARKSEMAGERLLLANSKLVVGYAATGLANFTVARDAFTEAQQMFAESGDVDGAALALMDIGVTLERQGELAGAKRSIEQSLIVFRKNGDEASLAAALTNVSLIYSREGDLPAEERLIRETLAISNKLNRPEKRDIETVNLGEALRREGRFREAKEMLEPLAQHLRGTGKKSLLGDALETLGATAEAQGDMATALRMYQEAAALFKDTGDKASYADAERGLGKAFFREADFVKARQTLSEALSVSRDIGDKADTALDQIALAEVTSAQAGPVDIGALRASVDELRQQKMTDDEIEAEIVVERELVRQGKAGDAAKVLDQTIALSAKSYDPTVRFDVALASTHLRITQHRLEDARSAVRSALQRAMAIGCVRCEFEAQLELGEIEMQAGNAERGHAQLQRLADEAGRRGFHLIAERAATESR